MMKDIISTVREKLVAGQRIGEEEALQLYEVTDLFAIGELVRIAIPEGRGSHCALTLARRIRYSNVCRNQCRYCTIAKAPGQPGAYTRSVSEIVDLVGEAVEAGTSQFQLTGGTNPDCPYSYYLDMVSSIRRAFPQVHLQGFAPAQVVNIADMNRISTREVLMDLHKAGLDSVLEDGADIFDPAIRRVICNPKATGGQWLQVMREAHELGIPAGASMLYGHLEGPEEKVAHLMHLRDLQDETHSFTFYAPRAYRARGNGAGASSALNVNSLVGGQEDLLEFAMGRIFLNDFPGIRCYANDLGMKTTQIALHFGVNSVVVLINDDEPVDEETRMAQGMPTMVQLRELVLRAGFRVTSASLSEGAPAPYPAQG